MICFIYKGSSIALMKWHNERRAQVLQLPSSWQLPMPLGQKVYTQNVMGAFVYRTYH